MTDELQQIFNLIIDNTLEKDVKNAIYRPVCVALLTRLYKANENISFSKDITNAVTKIFDLDITEIYEKEKSEVDHEKYPDVKQKYRLIKMDIF